jgi:ribosomal protein S4
MMAVVQLRKATPGREFHDARKAGGTPSLMAMRSLERRLSNIVYARMFADQNRREITHQMVEATGAREGPGATTLTPARPAHNPTPALRTSHFPDRQQPA